METNVSNKILHETKSADNTGLKCSICGRTFETKRGLMRHTYIHQSNPKFNCEVCGKIFTSQDSLTRHLKSHQREKKAVQCKHCSESFLNKTYLEEHHRNVHLGQKLFQCTVCGAEFSWEENLQKHQRMHTVDNYRCEFCERIFCDTISLRIHQRVHRPSTKPPSPNCKPFHCSLCDQRFQFDFSYKAHMNSHKIEIAQNSTDTNNLSDKNEIIAEFSLPENNSTNTKELIYEINHNCGNSKGKASVKLKPEDEDDIFENSIHVNRIPANEISIHAHRAVPYKVSEESPQVLKKNFQKRGSKESISELSARKRDNSDNKDSKELQYSHPKTEALDGEVPAKSDSDDQGYPMVKKRRAYSGRFGTLDMTDTKPFTCSTCTESFRWEVSLNVHLRVHEPGYNPNEDKSQTKRKINKLQQQYTQLKNKQNTSPLKSQLVKRRAGSDDEDDDEFQTTSSSSSSPSKISSVRGKNRNSGRRTTKDVESFHGLDTNSTAVVIIKKKSASLKEKFREKGNRNANTFAKTGKNRIEKNTKKNIYERADFQENKKTEEELVITSITPILSNRILQTDPHNSSHNQVVLAGAIKNNNRITKSEDKSLQKTDKPDFSNCRSVSKEAIDKTQELQSDLLSIDTADEDNRLEDRLVIDTLDDPQLYISGESEKEISKNIWNEEMHDSNSCVNHAKNMQGSNIYIGNSIVANKAANSYSSTLLPTQQGHDNVIDIVQNSNVETVFSDNEIEDKLLKCVSNHPVQSRVDSENVENKNHTLVKENDISLQFSQLSHTFTGPITEITPIPVPPAQTNYESNIDVSSISQFDQMFPNSTACISSSKLQLNSNNYPNQSNLSAASDVVSNRNCHGSEISEEQDIDKTLSSSSGLGQSSSTVVQNANSGMIDYIQGTNFNVNLSDHQILQGISNFMHLDGQQSQRLVSKCVASGVLGECVMKDNLQSNSVNIISNESMSADQNLVLNIDGSITNSIYPPRTDITDVPMVQELQNIQVSHDLAQNINTTQNVLQDVQLRQNVSVVENLGSTSVQHIQVGQTGNVIQNFTGCQSLVSHSKDKDINTPLSNIHNIDKDISVNMVKQNNLCGNSHVSVSSQSMKLPITQNIRNKNASIQNIINNSNENLQAMQEVVCKIPLMPSTQPLVSQTNTTALPDITNFGQNQFKALCQSSEVNSFQIRQAFVPSMQNVSSNTGNVIAEKHNEGTMSSETNRPGETIMNQPSNFRQNLLINHHLSNTNNVELQIQNRTLSTTSENTHTGQSQSISNEGLNNTQSDLIVVDSNSPVPAMTEIGSVFPVQSNVTERSTTSVAPFPENGSIQINISNTNTGQIIHQNIVSVAGTPNNQQNSINNQQIFQSSRTMQNNSSVPNNGLANLMQSNLSLIPQNTVLCQPVPNNVQFIPGSLPNVQSSMLPLQSNIQSSVQQLGTMGMAMQSGMPFLGNVPNMLSNVPIQTGYLPGQQINCINEFGQIVAVTPLFQIPVNQNQMCDSMTANVWQQNHNTGILQGQQIITQPIIGQNIIHNTGITPSWPMTPGVSNLSLQGSSNNGIPLLNNNMLGQNTIQNNISTMEKMTQMPFQIQHVNLSSSSLPFSHISNLQPQTNINHVDQLDGCYQCDKLEEGVMVPFVKDSTIKNSRQLTVGKWELPQTLWNHLTWLGKLNQRRKANVCFTCGLIFASRCSIEKHRLVHQTRSLECDKCAVKFPHLLRLIIHKSSHSKLNCRICGKTAVSVESLRQHLFFHQRLFPGIQCNVCGQLLLAVKGLTNHMQTHCCV